MREAKEQKVVPCLCCILPVVSRTTVSKLEFGEFDQ